MKNLLLISTSYRIRDLAEVVFAFGEKVEGFSIERKGKEIKVVCGYKQVGINLRNSEQKEKIYLLFKPRTLVSSCIGIK